MTELALRVNVLLRKDGDVWVAQCLQHDVAAQGNNVEEAKRSFVRTLAGQILMDLEEGKKPLEDLDQAPFWWFELAAASSSEVEVPVFVPVSSPRMRATAVFLQPTV